jgi:regulatory protein
VDGCIDEEQLEELLSRSRYNRVRSRALYYLSGRDYAAKELERKLSRSFDREVCRAVVERFVEVGLINDATYAERMARNLTEYKQYPRRRVMQALQEKGVSRAVAQAALDALEPDDFQQALALIQKKYYNR